jgi:hypothetical protein
VVLIGFGVFEGDGVNEYVGGLKSGLIGFVFLKAEGGLVFITLCGKEDCVHSGYMEIGFVLHKNELIYRVFSTDVEDRGQLTEDSCEVPNASCQLTEIHSS